MLLWMLAVLLSRNPSTSSSRTRSVNDRSTRRTGRAVASAVSMEFWSLTAWM